MPPTRVIGIDAGGTKLLGGVVDEQLVVHHRVHRLWRGADRGETLDIMVDAVEEVRAAAPDVEAVGFGIPSIVEFATGASLSSVHLPLDDVPFRSLMSERLDLPVHVDNDANAALLAEARHGAARGAAHAVLVALGTGIGGGLWLDGRLYRGAGGGAGELGHMVVDHDGPPCGPGCPGVGCLEVLASGRALGTEGSTVGLAEPESALGQAVAAEREVTGALVTELAHDGDVAARRAVAAVGRRLGAGLTGIVNVFNPEVIVIGGGAGRAGELLLEPAREVVAARALAPNRDIVRIVAAEYGEESGMMGAALMALGERAP
jgi:glucokinase